MRQPVFRRPAAVIIESGNAKGAPPVGAPSVVSGDEPMERVATKDGMGAPAPVTCPECGCEFIAGDEEGAEADEETGGDD